MSKDEMLELLGHIMCDLEDSFTRAKTESERMSYTFKAYVNLRNLIENI